ncbi:MAG: phospholipid scramblase-related protein [Microthrixaceae bacterium]
MTDQPTPANWYADPSGRHQYRYWDGSSWTEHVSTNGQQLVDPLQPAFGDTVDRVTTVGSHPSPQDVQAMVQGDGRTGAGIPASAEASVGSGTIWTEPVLVVTQKAKLIEVNNQYSVFDQHGRQLAFVNQVGQSAAKKVIRVLTSLDQYMTHKLEITDANGQVQLRLTRPAKFIKSTIIVEGPDGAEIGKVIQDNAMGKIHFTLESHGTKLGSINAENWRAWNFNIRDVNDVEIARITKTWEGLAKTMFTTADNYVVQIHQQIPQPLLSLVVASALTVDTALKQDSRGLS